MGTVKSMLAASGLEADPKRAKLVELGAGQCKIEVCGVIRN